jgi:hypothetical protein
MYRDRAAAEEKIDVQLRSKIDTWNRGREDFLLMVQPRRVT